MSNPTHTPSYSRNSRVVHSVPLPPTPPPEKFLVLKPIGTFFLQFCSVLRLFLREAVLVVQNTIRMRFNALNEPSAVHLWIWFPCTTFRWGISHNKEPDTVIECSPDFDFLSNSNISSPTNPFPQIKRYSGTSPGGVNSRRDRHFESRNIVQSFFLFSLPLVTSSSYCKLLRNVMNWDIGESWTDCEEENGSAVVIENGQFVLRSGMSKTLDISTGMSTTRRLDQCSCKRTSRIGPFVVFKFVGDVR